MVDCIADRLPIDTDLPKPLCEYIIVRELVHLFASNHSRVFKSLMLVYLPDWKGRREMLREYGRR